MRRFAIFVLSVGIACLAMFAVGYTLPNLSVPDVMAVAFTPPAELAQAVLIVALIVLVVMIVWDIVLGRIVNEAKRGHGVVSIWLRSVTNVGGRSFHRISAVLVLTAISAMVRRAYDVGHAIARNFGQLSKNLMALPQPMKT